ncbi:MAG: hypothetical protein KGI71_05645 [Patescibacteria group bacterium]|nr:hypothetical protein [Patescibacteria group bacterium]
MGGRRVIAARLPPDLTDRRPMPLAHARHQSLAADGSGIVVGGAAAQPCGVTFYGIAVTETGGTANLTLDFYTPLAGTGNQNPALPSASGTHLFSIVVPKGTSVQYTVPHGVYFKDGLYIASNGASAVVLGVAFYS